MNRLYRYILGVLQKYRDMFDDQIRNNMTVTTKECNVLRIIESFKPK